MSYQLAILYFLKSEYLKDKDCWFTIRDVSAGLGLSFDRTRRHLSYLVLKGYVETHIDDWRNVYHYKRG